MPDPIREFEASLKMTEDALVLDETQRQIVEKTIEEHCRIRNWLLHCVNCRTNHVHVAVTADRDIHEAREQLKAWCTRKLKERERALSKNVEKALREKWWTERGWDDYVDDQLGLEMVIVYVRDGQ